MDKKNTDQELFKIAPKLSELGKENPFLLPSGYFDELPQQIQQRLENAPERTSLLFGLIRSPKMVFAGMSLFLLLLLGYHIFLNDSKEELPIFANEFFFDDHLAWYSEYQPEAYYEMIFSEYEETDDAWGIDDLTDDQLTEYLLEYDEYFLLHMPTDYISEN